ncbi:MAG: hypothetical protein WA908_12950, partial [Pontixanthobacter sp.]
LTAGIIGALFVWNSAVFACIAAAIPLAWLTARLLETVRGSGNPIAKLAVASAIVILLLPSAPVQFAKNQATPTAQAAPMSAKPMCDMKQAINTLNTLPRGTVLAPLSQGSRILAETLHAVVAVPHRRATAAMKDVIAAFVVSPDKAERIARQHNANYVLLCDNHSDSRSSAKDHTDGFAAPLAGGDAPHWLTPVDRRTSKRSLVWRVTP